MDPEFTTRLLNKWVKEHAVAQEKLEAMDRALAQNDWKAVQSVARWLYEELKVHNEAEEKWLFPRLEERMGNGFGPTAAMRSEHRHIWAHEEALMAGLVELPPADPEATAGHAREIVEVLSAHIFKENNVLYPMAEKFLSAKELQDLDEAYRSVEMPG